jgi:hypothetical protein
MNGQNRFDWRLSELIKGAVLIFSVGVAWALMTMQLRTIATDIAEMNNRIAHIEQYIVKESKGDFVPQEQP